jgi:hypothetical protein
MPFLTNSDVLDFCRCEFCITDPHSFLSMMMKRNKCAMFLVCRVTEVGLLGLMALLFVSDIFHGLISEEMRLKFNYPSWYLYSSFHTHLNPKLFLLGKYGPETHVLGRLAPLVGTLQLLVVYMTWSDFSTPNKEYSQSQVSQGIVALLMGGCSFTHVKIAKRLKDASGAAVFFMFSCLV